MASRYFWNTSQYQFVISVSVFLYSFAGVNRQDLEAQTAANTDANIEMISWCTDASTLFIESENPSFMAKGKTEIFNSLGVYSRRCCLSKTAKFLGGESSNEFIHSVWYFEFLNSCCSKSVQYIRLIFTGRISHWRPMSFQYSELIYL